MSTCTIVRLTVLVVWLVIGANGQRVFVATDTQQGAGILRSRGDECFVVTAGHILKNPGRIRVVDSRQQQYSASLMKLYSGSDIAILRVDGNGKTLCNQSEWSSESQIISSSLAANKNGQGKIVRVLENGTIQQMQVSVKTYDLQYVTVSPTKNEERITLTWSGSSLYLDTTLVGMLVDVNTETNQGELYRTDYIEQLISPFFADDQGPIPPPQPQCTLTAILNPGAPPQILDVRMDGTRIADMHLRDPGSNESTEFECSTGYHVFLIRV